MERFPSIELIRRGPGLAVVVALAGMMLALAIPAAAQAWPDCTPRTTPIETGIREVDRSVDGRLLTLRLRSRAMEDVESVNVLLPRGYRSDDRRYPTLYLLHGALGNYNDWIEHDAARIIGGLPAIVVMPDGGSNGTYSDWIAAEPNREGPFPAYESYYMRELMPFVDASLRTRRGPANHAIAGLSMGGHGATKLAAEYPGRFGYVGSFSGAVDPELPLYQSLIQQCIWDDPATEEVVWRDNDPTALAGNLRGIHLFIRSGDGSPGPYDDPDSSTDPVELIVRMMNDAFIAALDQAGVHGADVELGAGTHTWPYWQRDLGEFAAWLRPQVGEPVPTPRRFEVESAHETVDAWGWRLDTHRQVREFLYLQARGPRRLTLTGSGRVDVRTPPDYRPGRSYAVRGDAAKGKVTADRRGRLAFRVGLGPSHTTQQTEFGPEALAGWRSATIRIGNGG